MAIIFSKTLTANSLDNIKLRNIRANRNIYTVWVAGDFGGGTITALLSGNKINFVPIKDSSGTPISLTEDEVFNFEAQSDPLKNPLQLQIRLDGATSPDIDFQVYDGA